MLSAAQVSNAVSLNRYYAFFLQWNSRGTPTTGWVDRYDGIVTALCMTGNASDEASLAQAVADWQRGRGLLVDGVIGTNTWASLEPHSRNSAMCVARPAAFQSVTAAGFSPPFNQNTTTASPLAMPGRGFMFVVTEVLPDVGSRYLVRKVQVIPNDFRIRPAMPAGTTSTAMHALGGATDLAHSPWISTSNRPTGAANFRGQPVLVDMDALRRAGGNIVSEADLIADLNRLSNTTPHLRFRIEKLISAIRGIEGETLIGGRDAYTVRPVSRTHSPYVTQARNMYIDFEAGNMTRPQLEDGLHRLNTSYGNARMVGRVGRVVSVVGLVMTAVDLGHATHQSIEQRSARPITAEGVRQVGGWAGAIAGMKLGGMAGAAVGVTTGPGAIVTGAIGAIIGGAAGFFAADWLADHIHEN